MPERMYGRAVELMEAELGDELVALDPRAGECFGFNSVATSVWRQLASPKSFDQLRNDLLDEYDVDPQQCSNELNDLLQSMVEKGLLTERS